MNRRVVPLVTVAAGAIVLLAADAIVSSHSSPLSSRAYEPGSGLGTSLSTTSPQVRAATGSAAVPDPKPGPRVLTRSQLTHALLPASSLPAGFSVSRLHVGGVSGGSSSSNDSTTISPARCGSLYGRSSNERGLDEAETEFKRVDPSWVDVDEDLESFPDTRFDNTAGFANLAASCPQVSFSDQKGVYATLKVVKLRLPTLGDRSAGVELKEADGSGDVTLNVIDVSQGTVDMRVIVGGVFPPSPTFAVAVTRSALARLASEQR